MWIDCEVISWGRDQIKKKCGVLISLCHLTCFDFLENCLGTEVLCSITAWQKEWSAKN